MQESKQASQNLSYLSKLQTIDGPSDISYLHVEIRTILTLKMPRKPASKNIVCLCRLLNILANFSNLFLHTGK